MTAPPAWDVPAVDALAARLRLRLDPRRRQRLGGAQLGARPGASLELHDHRLYQPGDDLRHVDWGVYARTDQLVLRRHEAEVSPRLELLLDTSASLGLTPDKRALAWGLTALLMTLAAAADARPTLWLLGEPPRRVPPGRDAWRAALAAATPAGAAGLAAHPAPALAPGAERVLITDGLCPTGAASVVRRLGAGAGAIAVIEVLTREERDPTPVGAVRLEDVEGGALELVLDAAACAAYRARLERHRDAWRAALARAPGRGPGLVPVLVDDGLDAAASALVAAGLAVPRDLTGGRR